MAILKLTGQQIIDKFHDYVDDDTALSSQGELDLLNKKYNQLAIDRPWEWTKATFSQAVTSSTTYLTLPDGFLFLDENNDGNYQLWIGSTPYPIMGFAQRRDHSGLAYIDIAGNKIYMPSAFPAGTASFDYHKQPDLLTVSSYPGFPGAYHPILYHMMAIDHEIIDRSEKARSYRAENEAAVVSYFEDLAYYDGKLKQQQNLYS